MPGPAAGKFAKVTFAGHLVDGVQEWSTSCWFSLPGTTGPGDAAAFLAGVLTAYGTALKSEVLRLLASTDSLDTITVDSYGPDSATLYDQAVSTQTSATTGVTQLPPQIAIVATLVTAGFGKAFRGRMYWPGTGNPTSDHRVDSANTVGLANALALFFTDVNAFGAVACLISNSRAAFSPLVAVQVDDVYDTQRRRRDKVLATKVQRTAI